MFFSSGFISRKKRRGPCFHLIGLLVVGGWFIMGKTKTEEAVSSCWFNCWSGLLYNKVSLVGRTRGKYVFGQEKQLVK